MAEAKDREASPVGETDGAQWLARVEMARIALRRSFEFVHRSLTRTTSSSNPSYAKDDGGRRISCGDGRMTILTSRPIRSPTRSPALLGVGGVTSA